MHCHIVNFENHTVKAKKGKNEKGKKEQKNPPNPKLLCPLQLCQNNINSPNICFIVARSIQVSQENKEKNILKSDSLEKFIGDYVYAVTNNFTLKKTTTFKPY